jgi:hypothetical protein
MSARTARLTINQPFPQLHYTDLSGEERSARGRGHHRSRSRPANSGTHMANYVIAPPSTTANITPLALTANGITTSQKLLRRECHSTRYRPGSTCNGRRGFQ